MCFSLTGLYRVFQFITRAACFSLTGLYRVFQSDWVVPRVSVCNPWRVFQFDWVNFINGLVQYGAAPPQITPGDRIVLTATAYLNRLFPLLDRTADRSVWRAPRPSSSSSSSSIKCPPSSS